MENYVAVPRIAEVLGVSCPQGTVADTTNAVKSAFNLSRSPCSSSTWLVGQDHQCVDGIGDIEVRHIANQKTNSCFYWQIEEDLGMVQPDEITLKFEMKLWDDYQFVKGGKLPGLFGGAVSCSGGADAAELGCFSTRLMWRRDGDGELYLYAPHAQAEGFCDRENYHCNLDYGNGVERGSFVFVPGQWQKIEQRVKLNDPGELNGVFMLFVDDVLVIDLADLNYRQEDSIHIMGMLFNTFYGGSDDSWYPTEDQYAYFKNFSLDGFSLEKIPSTRDFCADSPCNADEICTNSLDGFSCATAEDQEIPEDLSEAFCNDEISSGNMKSYTLKGKRAKMKRRGQRSYLYALTVGRAKESKIHTGLIAYGVKHCGEDFVQKLASGEVTIDLIDNEIQYTMEGHSLGQTEHHQNVVFQYHADQGDCEKCLGTNKSDKLEVFIRGTDKVDWGNKDPEACILSVRNGHYGSLGKPKAVDSDHSGCVAWTNKYGQAPTKKWLKRNGK